LAAAVHHKANDGVAYSLGHVSLQV